MLYVRSLDIGESVESSNVESVCFYVLTKKNIIEKGKIFNEMFASKILSVSLMS